MEKIRAIKIFLEKYERRLSSVALVLGFIIDNFTLRRVDVVGDNLVFGGYLTVVALCIVIINLSKTSTAPLGRYKIILFDASLFAMQFCIGGLFSGFLVFYSRSATFSEAWPFLLVLSLYLLGNEVLRKHYVRLTVQISIFFAALFSYAIFAVPIVMKMMGAEIFIASGFLSLLVLTVFMAFLKIFIAERIRQSRLAIIASVSAIFIVINVLYFTNLIPPIPLALKEAGVYHHVTRNTDGSYVLDGETASRWHFFNPYPDFHVTGVGAIYAFSAIFAPTSFTADVVQVWEKYDDAKKEWEVASRVPLSISGGRDGGYRTYSYASGLSQGKWRVSIETLDGKVVGRIPFTLIHD